MGRGVTARHGLQEVGKGRGGATRQAQRVAAYGRIQFGMMQAQSANVSVRMRACSASVCVHACVCVCARFHVCANV